MIIGIVAVDRNGAIGKGGTLPWHYSADMKFFKATTSGNAVVMGKNTWRSLKKPLPNRLNVVLSRSNEVEANDSVVVVRDVESVLDLAKNLKCDVYVIGGAQVYQSFRPYIDKWLVTEVPLTVEGADTFVPDGYLDGFVKTDETEIGDGLEVVTYVRKQ